VAFLPLILVLFNWQIFSRTGFQKGLMDGNFLEAAILIAMPTAWKH